MKRSLTKVFSALCALALLLAPAAAIAEGEQRDPIELNIGSDRNAWFVVPGDGLDTSNLHLNGASYAPQVNQQGNLVVRTSDLLAAKAIGENANEEPGEFRIQNGKISFNISVTVPDEDEAAQPPAGAAEAKPSDNPFQYVEDRTSKERLAYSDEVIKQYAQALIDGVADLIKLLESERIRDSFFISDTGVATGDPVGDASLPALLTYVTSLLSGDPVTAEAFDNAMYAIYSKLCVVDNVAANSAHDTGAYTRESVYYSALMGTFRAVMEGSGYHLPEYLNTSTAPNGVKHVASEDSSPWREGDYGRLDDLATVQKKLKEANPFQLEGVTFELTDGAGTVQPIIVKNVWQSPITVQHNPNDMVLPEAAGSKPIPQ